HKNQMIVAAKTKVRIASTEADVQLSAPSKHLLATAAGAYIRIEGDNIELGAPGKVEFKASQRDWVGPLISSEETDVPAGQFSGCEPHLNAAVCRQEGCADVG
ncbi:DUF2345 domain-containing protein, partial [Stenotrophomonas forensis]